MAFCDILLFVQIGIQTRDANGTDCWEPQIEGATCQGCITVVMRGVVKMHWKMQYTHYTVHIIRTYPRPSIKALVAWVAHATLMRTAPKGEALIMHSIHNAFKSATPHRNPNMFGMRYHHTETCTWKHTNARLFSDCVLHKKEWKQKASLTKLVWYR
jgi:hypothetical protein|mmetsp:Transcript_55997/g.90754  ORF Transcript_55997/g.90754 Transcript_55997/m.90754 type:complete len:157 (+) Transcript_55997:706-1176(+)